MKPRMDKSMIAPCGMNCGVCPSHVRKTRQCDGCRGKDTYKPGYCVKCVIKDCEGRSDYDMCYLCGNFPCIGVQRMDARLKEKFDVGIIKNQQYIRQHGMEAFLDRERKKWTCGKCGGIIFSHGRCSECGTESDLD